LRQQKDPKKGTNFMGLLTNCVEKETNKQAELANIIFETILIY
jgi:hypothetical protein